MKRRLFILILSACIFLLPINAYADVEGDGYTQIGGEDTPAANPVPNPIPVQPPSAPIQSPQPSKSPVKNTKKPTKKKDSNKVEDPNKVVLITKDNQGNYVVNIQFDDTHDFSKDYLEYNDKKIMINDLKEHSGKISDQIIKSSLTDLVNKHKLSAQDAMNMYKTKEYTDLVYAKIASLMGLSVEIVKSDIELQKSENNLSLLIKEDRNFSIYLQNNNSDCTYFYYGKTEPQTKSNLDIKEDFIISDPEPVLLPDITSIAAEIQNIPVENKIDAEIEDTVSDNAMNVEDDQKILSSIKLSPIMLVIISYIINAIVYGLGFMLYKKRKGNE